MYHLIGDKKIFAVELDLSKNKWSNKTALWLNNTRLGDWEDENFYFPFLNSMYAVANHYENFWDEDLEGLDCYQAYLTMNPCYNDPDSFFDLKNEEQKELIRFDKFLMSWGENFDSWGLTMKYRNGICTFLWVHRHIGDSFEVRNNIQCHNVKLEVVQEVYKEFSQLIPDEEWPSLIPRNSES